MMTPEQRHEFEEIAAQDNAQALTYLLDVDPVLNECVDVALPRPPASAILAQLPNQ